MHRSRSIPLLAFLALGCGSSASSSQPTITVSGRVVNGPGTPVFGAKVFLNDDPGKVVTTTADGTFLFTGVSTPYSLGLVAGASVTELRGLTTAAPRITTDYVQYSALVSGSVTGVSFPLPAGQVILVGGKGISAGMRANPADGTFSRLAYWDSSASVATELVAVLVTPGPYGTTTISSFDLAGKRTGVTLTDGSFNSGLDIALTDTVPTVTSTVHTSFGAYNQGPLVTLSYFMIEGVELNLGGGATTGILNGDVITVPTAGATVAVQGNTSGSFANAGRRIPVVPGSTTVSLPASVLLTQTGPANGATTGRTPMFSWTPPPGVTQTLVLINGPGLGYRFYLPGSAASLTLPDLGFLGQGLAASTTYTWQLITWIDPTITPALYADPAGYAYAGSATTESDNYGSPSQTFITGP